jgi:23S rRNA pseudouridine1911/1915/1917 synthase
VPLTVRNIKITTELSGRADDAVRALTKLSRSQVQGLFDQGCINMNGAACVPDDSVKPGDTVEARYDSHRKYHPKPKAWKDDAFAIVHEDDEILVVNKSAGVLTVAANPGEKNTLVSAIEKYFVHRGIRSRPYVVHRLDRDVSGLLVFGKNSKAGLAIQNQFENRKPEREYAAIVHGVVPNRGKFESHLATTRNLQRYSTEDPDEGELAITHFELIKVVRSASWVRVWLETGRRNQIRVHFAEAGHPVLGDQRYEPDLSAHPRWYAKRLALHAATLGFDHPTTGKRMRFQALLPGAMRTFIGA